MKINQCYSTLNSIARQMWGRDALTVVDERDIISMGKTVLSSDVEKEKYLGVLADRIRVTMLRTLDVELDFPKLLKIGDDWLGIIQKINIQPFEAKAQKAWQIGENDFTPNNFAIDKPTVSQTFFTDANAFEFDVTIPDTMLKESFLGSSQYGAFIDGIMSTLTDSLTMALNNMSYLAIDNFVAEKLKSGNGIINVLTGYNTQAGTSYTTLAEAMDDKEFFRYTGMVIRNVIKYMGKPSALYNTAGMVRATARDNMHVLLSADYMSASNTYLSADTFWKELVALDGYAEFVTLQSTGVNHIPTITDNTKINVIPASNASDDSTAVIGKGIIGIICDREAIAVGFEDLFTATDRNNRNRYTNYTMGCTKSWLNDTTENGVCIVAHTDGISVNNSTLTFANPSASTQTITATTSPASQTVTWKSSDTDVATVASGVVTPVGKGSCVITATAVIDGVSYIASTAVTVTANS